MVLCTNAMIPLHWCTWQRWSPQSQFKYFSLSVHIQSGRFTLLGLADQIKSIPHLFFIHALCDLVKLLNRLGAFCQLGLQLFHCLQLVWEAQRLAHLVAFSQLVQELGALPLNLLAAFEGLFQLVRAPQRFVCFLCFLQSIRDQSVDLLHRPGNLTLFFLTVSFLTAGHWTSTFCHSFPSHERPSASLHRYPRSRSSRQPWKPSHHLTLPLLLLLLSWPLSCWSSPSLWLPSSWFSQSLRCAPCRWRVLEPCIHLQTLAETHCAAVRSLPLNCCSCWFIKRPLPLLSLYTYVCNWYMFQFFFITKSIYQKSPSVRSLPLNGLYRSFYTHI